MLKKLFFVFAGLLTIVLALLVFRFFYLRGMLGFQPGQGIPTPEVINWPSPDASLIFTPQPSAMPTNSLAPTPTISPAPRGKLVTIDVDDTAAGMYSVDVQAGTKVTLTLNVVNINVLRGGLDFRSQQTSTGVILPGQSRTVEFMADTSLIFTPYYADSNTPAPYTIRFNVFND